MKLHILGSNSSGNCYILENDSEALVIEAGVRWDKAKKALNYRLGKVVGAIISHEHNDHARYVRDVVASGVQVLALKEVFTSHGLDGAPFTKVILPGHGYRVGGFKVLAIPVRHDVPCVGYLVSHPDMGKLLFVTDTVTLDAIVPHVNHWLIEANYADDIVDRNIAEGRMPYQMRARLLNSHMEINETKHILAENDLSDTDNIILIHLSDGNSDERRFIKEVREQTGKPVYAANAGMELDLSVTPY